MVEPIHPFESGVLDGLQMPPRAALANDFSLVIRRQLLWPAH
jgi:hypothetical protein